MTQVYFHCSNTRKVFVDCRGAMVDDLAEARDHATRVVQSFTNDRSLEDWRDWFRMSATIRAMSSSLCPSLSCSASRIEIAMTVESLSKTLHCSFCGKSQHEVRKLIAGPTVFICDQCVELCTDIYP
jgi:ClpX C4-type zinc finger protein/uncharacterized protein DUF6894